MSDPELESIFQRMADLAVSRAKALQPINKAKKYYLRHREAINAKRRAKYAADLASKPMMEMRRYYLENHEVIMERKKAHYWAHRERESRIRRERYQQKKRLTLSNVDAIK